MTPIPPLTTPQEIQAPCGCKFVATHRSGDRLVTCSGGGLSTPRGLGSRYDIATEQEAVHGPATVRCGGGQRWTLHATEIVTVRYSVDTAPVSPS